jgi:acyl carrier protein
MRTSGALALALSICNPTPIPHFLCPNCAHSALNLEVAAADVQADEALYGDGLGLDSIDILEIALVVSKRYGLQLRADQEDNHAIFHSLRSLSDHIAAQRTQ